MVTQLRVTCIFPKLSFFVCLFELAFALVPFLIIVKRYCKSPALQEYVERFTKVALSMLLGVESKARSGATAQAVTGATSSTGEANTAMRRTAIVETLAKLLHLRCAALNECA